MDPSQFGPAIKQICEEKGISEDAVIKTIEAAMASAYRKDYGGAEWKVKADFDIKTGDTKFFRVFDVVEEVGDEENQISVKDANKKKVEKLSAVKKGAKSASGGVDKVKKVKKASKNKKYKDGDQISEPLEEPEDYGRIAAQTAKQVVIQRIREAEREVIFDDFKKKEGEVINGVVQQMEGRNAIIDLGKANGVLFPAEQIPQERYYIGQRLKVFVIVVEKTSKAPLISLSRAHEGLIKKLFELEVPEINAKSVEIKGIAREAGRRTKMAVTAHQQGVDPVGSCVGQRGTRVQAVLAEIGDEKIDIIEYQENPEKYIEAALSPAKIIKVKINKKTKTARVDVDLEQLSLAIGKEGQNVRLASKLTGFEIDIEKAEEKIDKVDKVAKVAKVDRVKKVDKVDKVDKVEKDKKTGKEKSAIKKIIKKPAKKTIDKALKKMKPTKKIKEIKGQKPINKEKSAEIAAKDSNDQISKEK